MKIITYYKKYTGNSNSIVDALKSMKISSSMENRKKIATLNNIKNYNGSSSQNKKMLRLLKKGKLIKKITIKKVETNAQKFVHHLELIDKLFRKYGKHVEYGTARIPKNYISAEKKLKSGKVISSTCVVPIKWGMELLKIDFNNFYANSGIFVHISPSFKKHTINISGKGYTVKEAVDKRYLKPGDICCFKGLTHTFVYTGKGYLFFDGGHAAMKGDKYTGIIVDYSTNYYRKKKLSSILRWK